MRIEFVHGPVDGQIRIVPDGTTFFEVAMAGASPWDEDQNLDVKIYKYKLNKNIFLVSGCHAFAFVGIRKPSRWSSGPKFG